MPAVITYRLARPCGHIRPFCKTCVNTFSIDDCGPTACSEFPISQIPTRLCVHPFLSGDTVESECSQCKDGLQATKYLAIVNYPADEYNPEPRTFGPIELSLPDGICETMEVVQVEGQPSGGICSLGTYILLQFNTLHVEVGCYGFLDHENFAFVVPEGGLDCLKVMTLVSGGGEVTAGPPYPPTDHTITLIPIGENLPQD